MQENHPNLTYRTESPDKIAEGSKFHVRTAYLQHILSTRVQIAFGYNTKTYQQKSGPTTGDSEYYRTLHLKPADHRL